MAIVAALAAASLGATVFAQPAQPVGAGGPPSATPTRVTASPTATSVPARPTPTPSPTATVVWVMNFEPARLLAGADSGSGEVAPLRQFTYLELLGYEDEWARVYNPRTKQEGFVSSTLLGPSDPPPAYLTAAPPPAVDMVGLPGRIIGSPSLAFYPTSDPDAQMNTMAHNAPVFVADSVEGDDGALWYRTDGGDYLPTSAVRLPRTPPRTFHGRWIDADLTEPSMLTAYEGDRIVLSALVIKGAGKYPTPTGVFSIQRRVEDETMSSDTIGIPRDGPGGYHLEHVLYTQYFLGSGESIHYNYWSSVWGYQGSHGCLGLPYEESKFLWSWATVGTIVSVHY